MDATADAAPLTIRAPEGPPRGGVVVVQEAFGVNDHIADVAGRVAAAGWLAVAPHLFHRTGDPRIGYDDVAAIGPHFGALTAEGVLADLDAARDHLHAAGVPDEGIGVVGFCMGGTAALLAAVHRPVGAAVTFYGGGLRQGRFGFGPLVDEARHLRAPWLGLFGDQDESIPVDAVEALREAAASSGQPTEVVRYPDAGHGFHCDQRGSFHGPSAADAWARTLAWFDRHLAS